MNFERNLNIVFKALKEWFNSNLLFLNFDNAYYIQFIIKNKSLNKINVERENKMKIQTNFVKFLGITVDNNTLLKTTYLLQLFPN